MAEQLKPAVATPAEGSGSELLAGQMKDLLSATAEQPPTEPKPPAPVLQRFKVIGPCHFRGKQLSPAREGDQPLIVDASRKDPVVICLCHFQQLQEIDAAGKPVITLRASRKRASRQP